MNSLIFNFIICIAVINIYVPFWITRRWTPGSSSIIRKFPLISLFVLLLLFLYAYSRCYVLVFDSHCKQSSIVHIFSLKQVFTLLLFYSQTFFIRSIKFHYSHIPLFSSAVLFFDTIARALTGRLVEKRDGRELA